MLTTKLAPHSLLPEPTNQADPAELLAVVVAELLAVVVAS